MKVIVQVAIIVSLALAAIGITWWLTGPPDRSLACDPSELKDDEICLQSIPKDADILWVDARSRAEWITHRVPGSVLWNLDPDEDMQAFEADVAMRLIETPHVVVYCGDESCGTSRQIAERIRSMNLGAEVYVLHGGWQALQNSEYLMAPSQTP